MPRLPRQNLPGIQQHIVQRGNNRQDCFFEEQDYIVYLDKLKEPLIKSHEILQGRHMNVTSHWQKQLKPVKSDIEHYLINSLQKTSCKK